MRRCHLLYLSLKRGGRSAKQTGWGSLFIPCIGPHPPRCARRPPVCKGRWSKRLTSCHTPRVEAARAKPKCDRPAKEIGMQRQRVDRLLVERGLFESRVKAQAAIAAGLVSADGTAVHRASDEVAVDAVLRAEAVHPWVSRGGLKLAAALDRFGFDPQGRVCLDVGASTGGFTQVLLARGARRVYAVDVGREQLDAKLKARAEIVSL